MILGTNRQDISTDSKVELMLTIMASIAHEVAERYREMLHETLNQY